MKFSFAAVSTRLLAAALAAALTGCVGVATEFAKPAAESEVPYTVVPVTAGLVSKLATDNARRNSELTEVTSANFATLAALNKEPYRIGVNDVLALDIFGLPSQAASTNAVNNLYVVQEDGSVIMPYAGTVKVAELTLTEARERVLTGMRRFIDTPQFNLRIVDYRSRRLLVAGEVQKPGYQFVRAEPLTLVDVITIAGPTDNADLRNVQVQRGDTAVTVNLLNAYQSGDLNQIPRMRDGDVVRLNRRDLDRIYISGAVGASSIQPIEPGRTMLSDVLMTAGGIRQETANASRVYVVRGTPANATVFHLNAASPEALILASSFPMQTKDVVFVSEAEIVRFGRILALLLAPVNGAVGVGVSAQTLSGTRN